MWDSVEDENQDLLWLVEGLRNSTIVAITNGSYDRQVAPTISGAGIVFCCTRAQQMLRANFYERLRTASSYRGKLLGLVALHMLILAKVNRLPSKKLIQSYSRPYHNLLELEQSIDESLRNCYLSI